MDNDVELLEDVDDEVEVEVDVLVEVDVDVLVEVEVLEEVEVDVEDDVELLEDVDEDDTEVEMLVEMDVDTDVEIEVLEEVDEDVEDVVLVVLVPPPVIPAWTTNGNITIAKTTMLNTIPILLIDISAPLLMLNGTFKILKCCCYVQVSRNMNER